MPDYKVKSKHQDGTIQVSVKSEKEVSLPPDKNSKWPDFKIEPFDSTGKSANDLLERALRDWINTGQSGDKGRGDDQQIDDKFLWTKTPLFDLEDDEATEGVSGKRTILSITIEGKPGHRDHFSSRSPMCDEKPPKWREVWEYQWTFEFHCTIKYQAAGPPPKTSELKKRDYVVLWSDRYTYDRNMSPADIKAVCPRRITGGTYQGAYPPPLSEVKGSDLSYPYRVPNPPPPVPPEDGRKDPVSGEPWTFKQAGFVHIPGGTYSRYPLHDASSTGPPTVVPVLQETQRVYWAELAAGSAADLAAAMPSVYAGSQVGTWAVDAFGADIAEPLAEETVTAYGGPDRDSQRRRFTPRRQW